MFKQLSWPSGIYVVLGLAWLGLIGFWSGPDSLIWAATSVGYLVQVLLAVGLLYLIPGLALLRWLWPDFAGDWPTRLTLALGMGFALPPVLLEAAALVRWHWNPVWVWAYIVLATVALLGLRPSSAWATLKAWRPSVSLTGGLLLALVLLATVGRFYVIRNLPAGMWADSYHHTLITQLLVDHGGLFQSWEPYAPLTTFTYHFGFHANAAFLQWLCGWPATQSVLVAGQIFNVAALTGVFALTAWLTGRASAGLWAAVIVGFINQMPGFYFVWGRYTQLAGQALLPMLLIVWAQVLEAPLAPLRTQWRLVLLAALLTTGMLLTHYIVMMFAAIALGVYSFILLVRTPTWAAGRTLVARSAWIAGLGALGASPWLLNLLSGYLPLILSLHFENQNWPPWVLDLINRYLPHVGYRITKLVLPSSQIARDTTLPILPPAYVKNYVLALGGVGWVVAFLRHHWRMVWMGIWVLAMLLALAPQVFGLPGSGTLTNFAVAIFLYLPVGVVAGYGLGWGFDRLQAWLAQWPVRYPGAFLGQLALAGAVLVAGAWGYPFQLNLWSPDHQILTQADVRALAWVQANTPADATFIVNTFPAYDGTVIIGSDGGWWLPYLGQRTTNLPPLTYGTELGPTPDYGDQVEAFAAELRGRSLKDMTPGEVDLTTAANVTRLRAAGYDYVYIGAHQCPPPFCADTIAVATLRAHPETFEVVYDIDGVVIFKLRD